MKFVPLFLVLAAFSQQSFAQSTLTLDDFDLGPETPVEEPANREILAPQGTESDMETCLLDPTACKNDEFKSGTTFSLDDVVNLGIVDREEVAAASTTNGNTATAAVEPLPTIDMEILFDYNSADLRPDQIVKIAELARVLNQDKFEKYRFLLLGHTDAKGSAQYNLALSQERAQAVAAYVSASAGLPAERMIATGMGASKLKDANDPYGGQNRRVQLVLVPVN